MDLKEGPPYDKLSMDNTAVWVDAFPSSATTKLVLLGTGTPNEVGWRVKCHEILVLYHILFWGSGEAELLEEISAGYDGNVVVGRDLDIF